MHFVAMPYGGVYLSKNVSRRERDRLRLQELNASTALAAQWLSTYKKSRRPLEVDIRSIVNWVHYGDRYTHFLHPYPGKLLAHIPSLFASAAQFSAEHDTVFDPFGGSGTVALESMLAQRSAITMDCNPLAALITKVKTTPLQPNRIFACYARLLEAARSLDDAPEPDVVNLRYWYHPHVIRDLSRLKAAISRLKDEDLRDFFLVCLSICARRLSLADPRLSVPVKLRVDTYKQGHWLHAKTRNRLNALRVRSVEKEFQIVVNASARRVGTLVDVLNGHLRKGADALLGDVRYSNDFNQDSLHKPGVQLIVTSPPYLGAQKYVRATSLSLGWLGLVKSSHLSRYEQLTIGREHLQIGEYASLSMTGIEDADRLLRQVWRESRIRAEMAAQYLLDMQKAAHNYIRAVKPGGFVVMVMGNNMIGGKVFRTVRYMRQMMEDFGLRLRLELKDNIKSRGLMTKRNRTAGLIEHESILVFERP